MTTPTFRVTSRTWNIRFTEPTPRLTGVTSGLHDVTIEPASAVITDLGTHYRVKAAGPKVLKSGALGATHEAIVTTRDDDHVYRHPAPQWLVDVIREVRS